MATEDGHVWHTIRSANGTWTPVGDVLEQLHYFGPVIAVAAVSAANGEAQFLMATADGRLGTPSGPTTVAGSRWARSVVESWDPTGDVTGYIGNPKVASSL